MNNSGIVICVRLDSRRIPNKALQTINGTPIIKLLADRLLKSNIPICVAFPHYKGSQDYKVHEVLKDLPINFYYGSKDNVLDRFFNAAQENNYQTIVRVTADDILIDTDLMKEMIKQHQLSGSDYTFVRNCIEGTGAEIVSMDVVKQAYSEWETTQPIEHLSYVFKQYSNQIMEYLPMETSYRDVRLTIDYPEDLEVMKCVYDVIGYNDFDIRTLKIHSETTLKNVLKINTLPLISVYTCAYNAEETIKRTIDSVLWQDMKNIEYIVVDDCSIDETREMLWGYNDNPRIKFIINDENIGLAASSNKALSQAKGRYYIRIDADDEFFKIDSLRKLYDEMEKSEHVGMCYSSYIEKSVDGDESIKQNSEHHAGCAMMNAKAFNEIKFNSSLRHWDGHDFYTRAKDRFEIVYHDSPTWVYNRSDGSMSDSKFEERLRVKRSIDGGD